MCLSYKTPTGGKTAPQVPKLGYKDWRVPQISAQGDTLRWGPAWSVIISTPPPILTILKLILRGHLKEYTYLY